jgi:hypothetical protein
MRMGRVANVVTRGSALVEHARWLESLAPASGRAITPYEEIGNARVELAWRAVARARDEERALDEHDTIPRIGL